MCEIRRVVFKVLEMKWILTEADLKKGKDAFVGIWSDLIGEENEEVRAHHLGCPARGTGK